MRVVPLSWSTATLADIGMPSTSKIDPAAFPDEIFQFVHLLFIFPLFSRIKGNPFVGYPAALDVRREMVARPTL
jgi:hypothetical protein